MSRAPVQVDCDRPLADMLELARGDRWRAIVRPGPANVAGGQMPGEVIAWCDNETAEGLSQVERAIACRHLKCKAVELVEAWLHCAGGSDGIGGGVVKCRAWVPA